MDETKTFGEWLRHRRRELDLTHEELARQVNCAPITVRKIEADQLRPSKQLAELLLEQLRVAVDERKNLILFARGGELLKSTSATVPHDNLPHPISSFIGREREIAEITRLINRSRMLTLTGAGGCGKTRLAIEVANQMLDLFPDGAWFVALAPLFDPQLVQRTIASVLGVREDQSRPLIETLCACLHSKHLLLILDNCEHLIGECAQVTDRLLQACPQLRVLATSREALGIEGEEQYYVPCLSLPEAGAETSIERIHQSEAVRLFVDRGTLMHNTFTLTPANSETIVQICRRLDGMPLAIELAAARVKLLTIQHIAEGLDDRFNLLTGGNRTALPRHQTLRAAIEWSYELLPESTRVLFRRLSVFAGGFTSDAAQAVCIDDGPTGGEVLSELSRLVDRSLVEVIQTGNSERYRMLETIREYARERLKESGEERQVRDRHLRYYTDWTEAVEPKLRGPEQIIGWDQIETEHDNIRTALEWSLDGGDAQIGLRLAGAMYWAEQPRSYYAEGVRWLPPLLATTGSKVDRRVRAKALLAYHLMFWIRSDFTESKAATQEALGIWRELGDNWWISFTLIDYAWHFVYEHDMDTALVHFREAVNLANGVDDKWVLAIALRGLGAALGRFDYSAARPVLEESIAIWQRIGDKVNLADALFSLGVLEDYHKNFERAASLLRESLTLYREAGSKGYAMYMISFSSVLVHQGDNAEATRLLREALSLAQEGGFRWEIAHSLICLAGVAEGQNEFDRAARLLGVVEPIFKSMGLDMTAWPAMQADYDDWTAAARSQLGEEAFRAAFAAGRAMTLEQAVKYALEEAQKP